MTITSRRGRLKKSSPPSHQEIQIDTEVYIWHSSGSSQPLSADELEQVRRVFENIRKQLDGIVDIQIPLDF